MSSYTKQIGELWGDSYMMLGFKVRSNPKWAKIQSRRCTKKPHALNGHHNTTVLRWQTYSSLNQLTTSYLQSVKTLCSQCPEEEFTYFLPLTHPFLDISQYAVLISLKLGLRLPVVGVPSQVFAPLPPPRPLPQVMVIFLSFPAIPSKDVIIVSFCRLLSPPPGLFIFMPPGDLLPFQKSTLSLKPFSKTFFLNSSN